MANIKIYRSRPVQFYARSNHFNDILKFQIVYLQKVDQDRGAQFFTMSPFDRATKVVPCISAPALTVSEILRFQSFVPLLKSIIMELTR